MVAVRIFVRGSDSNGRGYEKSLSLRGAVFKQDHTVAALVSDLSIEVATIAALPKVMHRFYTLGTEGH